MVLLASWCALRFGELTELRRKDIDIEDGVIRVRRAVVRTAEGFRVTTPRATRAREMSLSRRTYCPRCATIWWNTLSQAVIRCCSAPRTAAHLQPSTLYRWWYRARDAAGRPDLRFHDLRHSGAVLAAQSGATLAELMARLGHSTAAAALRYQHASQGRDRQIAEALSRLAGDTPHVSPGTSRQRA